MKINLNIFKYLQTPLIDFEVTYLFKFLVFVKGNVFHFLISKTDKIIIKVVFLSVYFKGELGLYFKKPDNYH